MNEDKLRSLLQYKSNEMIPSTQLIRKSKQVFDAIQYNEVDKAVILRDGKPSFLLMDFGKYEELINFFISNKLSVDKELAMLETINIKETERIEEKIDTSTIDKEINEEINIEHQSKKSALLDKLDNIEGIINNDKTVIQDNLKDFWE
ncbi:MAG: hypothetical protein C0626_04110 [Arcobacter sp.]|uniref:hypothetical protein n=1 Tax=uncultured Arcobacter sp. TaxID=165434 RepID=UPI000CB3F02D|nr:hypothetical protein [uncultured Arcobacter sp.]PLY10824.1 MAG: hypothetical protein C0626_04110 [Arcobacter sp.]